MLNAVLACPDTPVAAAVSVYPVPLLSMDRLEKVAIPAVAATVRVPESAPPAGFVPIATVTLPVNPVAVLKGVARGDLHGGRDRGARGGRNRSEEHTSELQSPD